MRYLLYVKSSRLGKILALWFRFLKATYRVTVRPRFTTEILKLTVESVNGWIGGCWSVQNISGGYHGLLKEWWDHFGLKGKGLVIGEEGIWGENVKKKLRETYPGLKVLTASLENSDVTWDITKALNSASTPYDWIICQAVLEHVTDQLAL